MIKRCKVFEVSIDFTPDFIISMIFSADSPSGSGF